MPIKTAIFDLDGTVFDSQKVLLKVGNKVAIKYNIDTTNIDFSKLDKYKNMRIPDVLKTFKVPFYKLPSIVLYGLKEYSKYVEEIDMFAFINETLEKLKERGVQLGVLSTQPEKTVQRLLTKSGTNMFDFTFSESRIGKKGNALKKIVSGHRLDPSQTIYIGDEVRDIEAAKKVRMKSGAVLWGLNGEEILTSANPDYIFAEPKEILKILE